MGPTCSIVYENEPMEKNTMMQKPRMATNSFFSWTELSTSILQGLIIAAGSLATYRFAVAQGADEALTRTMVFTMLITANIFLTLVNRSFYHSVLTTLRYKNNLVLMIIGITIGFCVALLFIKPLTGFFGFERMSISQIISSVSFGFVSVMWYEIVKFIKRKRTPA
jgi:Ca2+-transporting ATPase